MDQLPRDPAILLSYINTKLRNEGVTLAEFCREIDADEREIRDVLSEIGYTYHEAHNRFE